MEWLTAYRPELWKMKMQNCEKEKFMNELYCEWLV